MRLARYFPNSVFLRRTPVGMYQHLKNGASSSLPPLTQHDRAIGTAMVFSATAPLHPTRPLVGVNPPFPSSANRYPTRAQRRQAAKEAGTKDRSRFPALCPSNHPPDNTGSCCCGYLPPFRRVGGSSSARPRLQTLASQRRSNRAS